VFIKTRTKYASKGEIELAVFKAFRDVLIEVLSFGFGVAELVLVRLLAVLFVDGLFLIHTVFLEHAGELRIIVLIEEGWSHTERPPHTPTHTQTRGEINRLLHVRSTQDPGQEHPSQQP